MQIQNPFSVLVHKGKINPVMKRLSSKKVKMNEKDFLLVMIRVQTSDL